MARRGGGRRGGRRGGQGNKGRRSRSKKRSSPSRSRSSSPRGRGGQGNKGRNQSSRSKKRSGGAKHISRMKNRRGGGGGGRSFTPSRDWMSYIEQIQAKGTGYDWNTQFQSPTFDPSSMQTVGDRANIDANRMTIQGFDSDRITERTTNPYLSSGSARDDAGLADFWAAQERMKAQSEQRLRDIDTQRLSYSELLGDLETEGQLYSGELDRIRPVGDYYSSELARTQGFDKQFTDELKRLSTFDSRFKSGIEELKKEQDEYIKEYSDPSWADPRKSDTGKAFSSTIKSLEDQYAAYKTHTGNVQSRGADFGAYYDKLTSGHRDYQSYLGELQSNQQSLSDYTSQIQSERSQLEDYASAFSAARQRSAADAKSYTIRSQQGMATDADQGVQGIRSGSGYTAATNIDRNKSTKRRFNRDFRIDSFGNVNQPQINV